MAAYHYSRINISKFHFHVNGSNKQSIWNTEKCYLLVFQKIWKSGFLTWIVWYGCFLMMSPWEPTCHLGTTVQNFVAYKRVYFELQLEYFSLAMAWKDTIIASLQIERGWVRVGLLWDKQHKTHNNIIVRKSVLKWATFSSLVFIGPMLNEIQPFKNLKIYSEIYRCLEDVSSKLSIHLL